MQPWLFIFFTHKKSSEHFRVKISGYCVSDAKTEKTIREKPKYISQAGIHIVPNLKLQIARFPYKADYTTAFIASGNTMYK